MSEVVVVVTKKDPKRVEAGKKTYEKHLLKVKEEILRGDGSGNSSETGNSNTPEATSNTFKSSTMLRYVWSTWSACHTCYWFACVYFKIHQKSPAELQAKTKKDEIIDPFR